MSTTNDDQTPRPSHGILLEHTSDGIQEYDNPRPAWWTGSFWACILFSFLYAGLYMVGAGPGMHAEYRADLGVFYEAQFAKLGDLKPTPEVILRLAADPKVMQAAHGMFIANCAVCHAKDGGGGTGPNLTDGSYVNIKSVDDIFTVISNGVIPKGMPAWDKRFGEAQRVLLAAYVAHLRSTTPATPKAPQGDTIPPWSATPAATEDQSTSSTAATESAK